MADTRVYLFLIGAGLLSGILFGAAPAVSATSRDVLESLRAGRSTPSRRRTRLREALIATQMALSLALIVGAALLGRSALNARTAQPGFDPVGLVAAFADLEPTGRYNRESGRALFGRILDQVAVIPGVRSATIASETPIWGGHSRATVRPAERPDEIDVEAESIIVGPRYLETLRIPLLGGRTLGGPNDERERVARQRGARAPVLAG